MSGSNVNAVFYADSYHPIQAGSIDGTDVLPHDNAIYRALLCSSAGLYDPFGDPKVIGDPYRTVFVGRLSPLTNEKSLKKAMSRYGRVRNLRLVRDIVTGASRGYAFVEYETEKEMQRAYEEAYHSFIDDNEIIVDYNRQQLMPGWIPRRLGGGLGGKKESGQLRFGGRERPFRAPLHPIPWDDLKRLGIPPPPEGHYMPRFQVPSPPRRRRSPVDGEDLPPRHRRRTEDRRTESPRRQRRRTEDCEESPQKHRRTEDREESPQRHRRRTEDREESPTRWRSSPADRDSRSHRKHRHRGEHSHRLQRSTSRDCSKI